MRNLKFCCFCSLITIKLVIGCIGNLFLNNFSSHVLFFLFEEKKKVTSKFLYKNDKFATNVE